MKYDKKIQAFTLIEMLIVLLVSSILMIGIIQLLINSNNGFRTQDSLNRMQENGVFTMDYLIRDIRNSDYWGCLSDTTWITNRLNSGSAYYNFSNGIQGTANSTGGTVLAGTDTITVSGSMSVSGANQVIPPYALSTTAAIATNPTANITAGTIVLVADCLAGDIFQVTGASAGALSHATGSGTPGNASASVSKIYTAGSAVYVPYVNMYSVQNDSNGNPGLYLTTATGSQRLVDDIESMIILYGEDTDNDGTANLYVRANQVTNMTNVVSIRMSIVVRSAQDNLTPTAQSYVLNGQTITATDRRYHRVYTVTVVLRNRTS